MASTSLLFGLWHLLPTLESLRTNPAGRLLAGPAGPTATALASTAVATSVAGYGLAELRLRSGGLVAPILVHAAVDVAAFLGGRLAGGSMRPEPEAADPR